MLLSSKELLLLLIITGVLIYIPLSNWQHSDKIRFWSPLTMVCLIFLYYVVVGPFITLSLGLTDYKLINHRAYFEDGWIISLVALCSVILGFNFRKPKKRPSTISLQKDQRLNWKSFELEYWKRLTIIASLCIVALVGTGGLASQFEVVNSSEGSLFSGSQGTLGGYLLNGINLLIGASGLLFIATLDKKRRTLWLLGLVFFAVAVYTKQGFRWRHIALGMTLLSIYYIYRYKRVNLLLFMTLGIVGIMIMGFIGQTRSYGSGLGYSDDQEFDNYELLLSGFGESAVFMTTGFMVREVQEKELYIGWDPIVQTLVMPIPRAIWPGKPSGNYIGVIEGLYDGVFVGNGMGAAVLNFGEYYLMFGYAGVIVGYFIWGIIFRSVWQWFRKHRESKLAIVTYAVFFSYIYMIISRGYTPQVVMLFCFTVLPLYLIFNYHYKRVKIKRPRLAHS
ncbi:MAG: O-antigen polymerase [Cyclobacteriaceae bacterium]